MKISPSVENRIVKRYGLPSVLMALGITVAACGQSADTAPKHVETEPSSTTSSVPGTTPAYCAEQDPGASDVVLRPRVPGQACGPIATQNYCAIKDPGASDIYLVPKQPGQDCPEPK